MIKRGGWNVLLFKIKLRRNNLWNYPMLNENHINKNKKISKPSRIQITSKTYYHLQTKKKKTLQPAKHFQPQYPPHRKQTKYSINIRTYTNILPIHNPTDTISSFFLTTTPAPSSTEASESLNFTPKPTLLRGLHFYVIGSRFTMESHTKWVLSTFCQICFPCQTPW